MQSEQHQGSIENAIRDGAQHHFQSSNAKIYHQTNSPIRQAIRQEDKLKGKLDPQFVDIEKGTGFNAETGCRGSADKYARKNLFPHYNCGIGPRTLSLILSMTKVTAQ